MRPHPPLSVWLPAVVVAAAVMLPVFYLAFRAFGAGPEALWDLLIRGRIAAIIVRSLTLVAVVTTLSLLLATVLGWLTERTDLPGRRLWAILTILPLVVPSYIMAFLMVSALGPRGMLQQAIEGPLGIQRLPSIYGLPGAALVITLVSFPYALLTVRAALRGQSIALEDASRTLGHGLGHTFFRIILPQLRPALAYGGLLVALYTLSDFGAVSLLRYETFTWAIYIQYGSSIDRMGAAALSLVLVVLAMGVFFTERVIHGPRRNLADPNAGALHPTPVRLGYWTYPALALCVGVVGIGLMLPLGVLAYWLLRGLAAGEVLGSVWGAATSSLLVSAAAALLAVVAALPVVGLAVRHPGRLSSLVDRASHVGFALPGIVVALALVFFAARIITPVYQTHALLIFAYLILFLPVAMGPIRSSLLHVSSRLEEAARILGRRPLTVMGTITIPLVRPGILAGASLVFLTAMKELPATLLLSPFDFKTLATVIWSASSEAFFAQAALPALLLILLSSVPMAVLIGRNSGDR